MSEVKTNTKVKTGAVRLSYPAIWEPKPGMDDKETKKYGASLLIDKNDKKTLNDIQTVIDALVADVKDANKGKLPPKFILPLRDGDEEKPGHPEYAGKMFLNVSSTRKPGVFKKVAGEVVPITDEEEIYAGVYVKAVINLFTYGMDGKVPQKGISAGLNGIFFVKNGERLSGGGVSAADFEDEDDSDVDGDVDPLS